MNYFHKNMCKLSDIKSSTANFNAVSSLAETKQNWVEQIQLRSWYNDLKLFFDEQNYVFDLTYDDFISIITQPCYYCNGFLTENDKIILNNIDCLDPVSGFTRENTISCCPFCFNIKDHFNSIHFIRWLERIKKSTTYRPQGYVSLDRITDADGKEVSFEKALKYKWLVPVSNTSQLITEEDVNGPNLFVDQGRQIVAYAFGFRSPIANYTVQNFGVGTGLLPAKVTDVALQSPVVLSNGQTTKPIDAVDFLSPFIVRVAFTLGINDANGYLLTEMGLFSGGNALIARKVRTVGINKTSDFSPTFTWRIRF